jgi:hypothetical protein
MPRRYTSQFDAAKDHVASHLQTLEEEAAGWREQAATKRAAAEGLARPHERLKRRRLLQDAEALERRAAEAAEAREGVGARMADYEAAYSHISSSVGGGKKSAETTPELAPKEDAGRIFAVQECELPPGATDPMHAGCETAQAAQAVNFKQWLEQRDVSSVKEGLVSEMLQELTGTVPKQRAQNSTRCGECARELVLSTVKAVLVCPSCGVSQPHLDATPSCIAYDEAGRREMYSTFSYTYRRVNHLIERLSQMQAESAPEVTPELLEQVCAELHKRRVPLESVNTAIVKEVLKRLKKRRAYEHVILITCKLQGRPPPKITRDTMDKIRRMFEAVQRPFERHCPSDRANFLSYSYVLYKFMQLLGAYELLPYFTLLKGKTKLQKQDLIFRKICDDLDWEFIPSV